MRIPFWIARPVRPRRPLPAAPAARFAFTAAVLSRVAPVLRGGRARRAARPQPPPADSDSQGTEPVSDHESATRCRSPRTSTAPDKILAGLTARQAAILAAAAAGLWLAFDRHPPPVPPRVFAVARRPGRAGRGDAGAGRAGRAEPGPARWPPRCATPARRAAWSPPPKASRPPPPWADPRLAAGAGPLPAPLRLPATRSPPTASSASAATATWRSRRRPR